ncbi:HIT family protein [Aquamicrobium sp. LC103]|uniref:HIT family protein n=1 Tax=Aquamicrobium sp. LC103 TaxID=1120658 RepID=UPI00063EAEF2|nr:HIT family protein [Aquamicrobium sp. LC103]TKT79029.1 HIT family protein [Aquamicrobium sp. LC103]
MKSANGHCIFCKIASGEVSSNMVFETASIVAFLDINPIRPGHTQIVPREHHTCFDELPGDLLSEIAVVGQKIARAHKRIYGVERVGFAFTGTDVPHVHAHVVPMVASDDLTSRRYIAEETVTYRIPPRPTNDEFATTADRIRECLNGG